MEAGSPKVLIIDDSATVRLWLRTQLEENFQIFEGESCQDADRLLHEEGFDLLIMDNLLPDSEGCHFIQSLRQQSGFKQLPIIMISGTEDDSIIIKALESGANDFIRKPIDQYELTARIALVMRGREAFLQVEGLIEELKERTERDALTDALNRFGFQRHGIQEIAKAKRYRKSLGLVMMDIDFFKKVNDTHGHLVGDEILLAFTQLLSDSVRRYDLIGRYGGDEFVLVLPECGERETMAVANKLLTTVRSSPIETRKGALQLTTSIGLAVFDPTEASLHESDMETLDNLLARADQALYGAKEQGRNQAVLAEREAGGIV